nr:hypothetical protein [Methylocystis sp. H15]
MCRAQIAVVAKLGEGVGRVVQIIAGEFQRETEAQALDAFTMVGLVAEEWDDQLRPTRSHGLSGCTDPAVMHHAQSEGEEFVVRRVAANEFVGADRGREPPGVFWPSKQDRSTPEGASRAYTDVIEVARHLRSEGPQGENDWCAPRGKEGFQWLAETAPPLVLRFVKGKARNLHIDWSIRRARREIGRIEAKELRCAVLPAKIEEKVLA